MNVNKPNKLSVFTTGNPPPPPSPPKKNQKKASNNIFLENLKTTFQSLRNNNKVCLNVGDFKYDILKYEHNSVINEFLNLM